MEELAVGRAQESENAARFDSSWTNRARYLLSELERGEALRTVRTQVDFLLMPRIYNLYMEIKNKGL